MTVAAVVLIALAALIHVVIFVSESVTWSTPATWRRFAVASQADADVLRPLALNQGFYNLFLAVVALVGVAAELAGAHVVGPTLMIVAAASMTGAGVVLLLTYPALRRAALVQLLPPALGLLALGTAALLR